MCQLQASQAQTQRYGWHSSPDPTPKSHHRLWLLPRATHGLILITRSAPNSISGSPNIPKEYRNIGRDPQGSGSPVQVMLPPQSIWSFRSINPTFSRDGDHGSSYPIGFGGSQVLGLRQDPRMGKSMGQHSHVQTSTSPLWQGNCFIIR